MTQHLRQSSIRPQLLEIIQAVSAHSVQQHEAFHEGCLIVASLPLLDLDMPRHALPNFQRTQSADQ